MREPRDYETPLCAEIGGDFWFPEKESEDGRKLLDPSYAKSICRSCVHRTECAEWGIKYEAHGIWGGLVSRERSKIRSRRGITLKEGNVA